MFLDTPSSSLHGWLLWLCWDSDISALHSEMLQLNHDLLQ